MTLLSSRKNNQKEEDTKKRGAVGDRGYPVCLSVCSLACFAYRFQTTASAQDLFSFLFIFFFFFLISIPFDHLAVERQTDRQTDTDEETDKTDIHSKKRETKTGREFRFTFTNSCKATLLQSYRIVIFSLLSCTLERKIFFTLKQKKYQCFDSLLIFIFDFTEYH